jgi:hypothetical protein
VIPESFLKKWAASKHSERCACQQHFVDLCHLVAHTTPAEADPTGESFTFERGVEKAGGQGWADVWKKGYFGWEYKRKSGDLDAVFAAYGWPADLTDDRLRARLPALNLERASSDAGRRRNAP